MELGYNHPMGPLRLTDLVGLDVRLGIAEYLAATSAPVSSRRNSCATWSRRASWTEDREGFYKWDQE